MSTINLMKTDLDPPTEQDRGVLNRFLLGYIDGFNRDDKRAWRRFLKRLMGMEPGEMARIEAWMPRSGPYHRRHFAIINSVFDAQERVKSLDQFVIWLKIGSGWVDWMPGAKGGIVPIPKSISYAKADEEEYRRYHEQVIGFLRGAHAADYLWPHLKGDRSAEMMNTILEGFNE